MLRIYVEKNANLNKMNCIQYGDYKLKNLKIISTL